MNQPIYSSRACGWGNKNCYRVYSDRLDLDFLIIKKTFVIPANDLVDIWTSKPTTLRSLSRMGGLKAVGRGLKLDLADMFEHVGIECNRKGFRFLFFAPEDPAGFMAAVKSNLMQKPK